MMKALFWATGNMNLALAQGWLRQKKGRETLWLQNRTLEKTKRWAKKNKVPLKRCLSLKEAWPRDVRLVFLGFKPQQLVECAPLIKEQLTQVSPQKMSQLIFVSSLAATELKQLQQFFPQVKKWIRLMPSLTVARGQGTILWASQGLTQVEKRVCKKMLMIWGESFELTDPEIDLYTPISGCAPAILYQLVKDITQGMNELGANEVVAQKMLITAWAQTLVLLECEVKQSPVPLLQKIQEVASKGGVTQSILEAFESQKIPHVLKQALSQGLSRLNEMKTSFKA
jgi:pyrroline-5-carboxylate reductase